MNDRPGTVREVDASDLLGMGRKQCHCVGRNPGSHNYIQCGPLRSFEEGVYVGLALREEQLRPQNGVSKEGPAPMPAYMGGSQNVRVVIVI